MDADKNQQILGYFIEEAKEHLETLERGLLDLKTTLQDPEQVNELFRAAHSVKGGAAMLGFSSIQKTAHRLEDSFKVLKEQPVAVDQKLESLFLKGFDTLQELLESLQGPFGLREDEADKVVQKSDPVFQELQNYLNSLVGGGAPGGGGDGEAASGKMSEDAALAAIALLRQMLDLFRQAEDENNRQRLRTFCNQLAEMHSDLEGWQQLIAMADAAIARSENNYKTLAPVVIKEIKQATDLIALDKTDLVGPSPVLLDLAGKSVNPGVNLAENQAIIDLEPKAAAKILLKNLNKQQVTTLVKLLVKAVQSS
ncbi:Hpt domain-containing protein [Oxynema aestuarii]|uniref:Histidine kinase n=1 Tax=Oxynema aestuarii AP17 TaxID=2064643 RepID=A0A6H1U1Y1_9CYAN|nr:Hpt domain-containing protein [Oxynema aestuarii]QIZ72872.1 histidine kinase [Oxynema aestuarii AP17]